jgi:hypothetical protein
MLERLLVDRTFDQEDTHLPNTAEEFAMQHASAIEQRLLACIKDLEGCVSAFSLYVW